MQFILYCYIILLPYRNALILSFMYIGVKNFVFGAIYIYSPFIGLVSSVLYAVYLVLSYYTFLPYRNILFLPFIGTLSSVLYAVFVYCK